MTDKDCLNCGYCEHCIERSIAYAEEMQTMTEQDWQDFSDRHNLNLTAEEIETILPSSNADHDEEIEWLPYYKAACCLLASLVGHLCRTVHVCGGANDDEIADAKRLWMLHVMLVGVGPKLEDFAPAAESAHSSTALLDAMK